MYNPRSFQVEDLATLHDLIQAFNFGVVFSQADGAPSATHLPFMIETEQGPHGTLIAHMARANPHWKSWKADTELLVVFQGPHAYISPAWYENQEAVPTWNYAIVHAYGCPQLIHDPAGLRPLVESMVDRHEGQIGRPWETGKMEAVMQTMLAAIVGFEIPIARIEGKFKFNQNRSAQDQAGVVSALESAQDTTQRAVAELMQDNLTASQGHAQLPRT